MSNETRYSKLFWRMYDVIASKHPYVISHRGGTRSTKTYTTLQFLDELVPVADKAGDVTSVVSETLPHLKKGAIRDYERIKGHPLKNDPNWNESTHTYTYPNGAMLEFFSADAPSKVHGAQRKRLFVNEANHISYEIYRQLAVRTAGLIIIDYNPTADFWATEIVELQPTTEVIHSTYLDNPFLTKKQLAEIESYRETDPNWFKVYGLGLIGKLEGIIYDFDMVDTMPDVGGKREVYGMDFGYSADPTALIHCLIDTGRREIWLDELIYEKGMLNEDIAQRLTEVGVPKHSVPIFADCAEPKTIDDIKRYGFNIRPCYKSGKKAEQIQKIRGYKLHITKSSLDTIREARGYVWATDKNGKQLNEPIEINDHAMDAFRYGCFTFLSEYENKGNYSIL